jgi:hypothetical protein
MKSQLRSPWLLLACVGLLAALLSLGGAASAQSGPAFRVVVRSDNPLNSASDELLTDLFLKRRSEWPNGESVRPVDLKAEAEARRHFSKSVLHRSVAAVKSYWQQMIFSGRGVPPPELESDQAVIDYLVKHPGAVGYVSGSASLSKVKELDVH